MSIEHGIVMICCIIVIILVLVEEWRKDNEK